MEPSVQSSFVSIATSLTGLIGAITGLASIWITYLNYSRDDSKIKVRAFKRMSQMTPGVKLDKKTYLVISAANAGRRPITLNKAAFVSLKSFGAGISSSSMMFGHQKLEEGKSVDYLMEDEGIDYSDVCYVAVYDTVGNEYRHYLAPWYKRFVYWFLHITYLRRKPMRAPKKLKTSKSS